MDSGYEEGYEDSMADNLKQKLHVAIACGGTGGHIFPGVATAEILHARGHKVTLWLAGKDIEARAVEHTPWDKITISSKGWEGGWRGMLHFGIHFLRATKKSKAIMREDRPDVVLAMGSYAGMGPVRAATKLGIPVVLHEANSIPGRMITFFANSATRVGATFEMTRHELKNKARLHLTGMPLRKELTEAAARGASAGSGDPAFHILCMGGSRGARALNRITRRAVRELYGREKHIFITHLTGTEDEESVRTCYVDAGVPHHVAAFESDMAPIYQTVDLAICRAGASTCAELSVFGIPSLLVPYPYAAKDHQQINAEEFFRHKAADVIEESELEVGWLAEYIEGCMHTPERLERMKVALKGWAKADAASRLADLVEDAAAEG
jgi:UDP-N-acetylglucosamine--N-acetylmuramyl-(pentapeptide) pyrophosphoryl-undecaprenol N-acetylglucosamine transferase